MIDKEYFVSSDIGFMVDSQLEGVYAIFDEYFKQGYTRLDFLAYILATVYHETDKKMQPVKEYGGLKYLKSKPYYPYYGRDLVHTTWLENYKKVKAFTGIDVVTYPDLIAQLDIAAKVAIHFMVKGYYTGKKLSNYFNDKVTDPINARRIINGTDKALLIAAHYDKFLSALRLV